MIALALDMDDTLFREIDFFRSSVGAISETLSAEFGCSAADLFKAMSSDIRDPYGQLPLWVREDFSIEDFLAIYRAHVPVRLPLRPDALSLLKAVSAPMYVITDGRASTQRAKFNALGLSEFIPQDNLIISGETGYDKLTPFPFAIAMQLLDRAAQWIYVGDNPAKDFLWPNRLGWITVMLADSGHNVHPQNLADYPSEYHPRHIISNLTELLQLCQQLS